MAMKMAAMAPVTTLAVTARVGPGGVEVLVDRIGSVKVMVGISLTMAGVGTGVRGMRFEGMRVCS